MHVTVDKLFSDVTMVGWNDLSNPDDSDGVEGTVSHLTFIQCASLCHNLGSVVIDRLDRAWAS